METVIDSAQRQDNQLPVIRMSFQADKTIFIFRRKKKTVSAQPFYGICSHFENFFMFSPKKKEAMVFTRPEYNEKKLSPSAISVVRKGSIGLFRFRPVVSRRPG